MNTLTLHSSNDAADQAGITYRQLDLWVRHGVVAPTAPAQGSGTRRGFSDTDIAVLTTVAQAARALGHGKDHNSLGVLRQVAEQAASMYRLSMHAVGLPVVVHLHDSVTLTIEPSEVVA